MKLGAIWHNLISMGLMVFTSFDVIPEWSDVAMRFFSPEIKRQHMKLGAIWHNLISMGLKVFTSYDVIPEWSNVATWRRGCVQLKSRAYEIGRNSA
jgi:hypothetical protein